MAWHHELRSAVGNLLRRGREERELDEEVGFHLEMETQRNREAGFPTGEARRKAVRAFGGVARHKDAVRDERGTRWLDDVGQDLRFAVRSLRRRAGFTGVAVLTLALGVGATTALFGVVKSVLLTPLPYGGPEGVAVVWSAWKGFDQTWLSYDEWEAWDAQVPAFADVALFSDGAVTLTAGDGSERVRAGFVDRDVFRVLDVRPRLGRGFTAEEDRPGGPRAIVLGHRLWQRSYGADPSIVGREVQVGGEAATVVGVMPAGFRLPLDFGADGPTEAWLPLATDAPSNGAVAGPAFSRDGQSHGYYGVARLAPGATVAAANAQLRDLVAALVREGIYPPEMQFRAFAVPVDQQVTGRVRPALLVVFGAVGFVLLIACANVAGLLLVRGEHRRRELAVRVALGAGARRLGRLLLTESVVLAALGGALGVALAGLAVWLVRRTAPAALPRVAETTLDGGVLLFALGVTAAAALLAGVLPALQVAHVAPARELKEGGRAATAGPSRLRWRQLLVAGEVALAVVLAAGAGLMVRSVANLLAIDAGFEPTGVLTMRLSTPSAWYPDSVRVAAFHDELARRVAEVPGVAAVGAARLLPLSDEMGDWGLRVEGYTPPPHQGTPGDWQVVTPGYFEAMGLRLRAGRVFDARDRMDAPFAMIVNEEFVDRYFAGREPLGRQVRIGGDPDRPAYTVVGVVDDVRHNALTREVKPQFYAPLAQFAVSPGNTMRSMSLVVRTADDPMALAGPVRAAIRALDPRLPVSEVQPMTRVVADSIAEPRFAMGLLALFGLLALTLAAIGVFGVVSQVVASRAHEFGIRAALGAAPRDLVRLSLGMGVRQAAAGLAVGLLLALLLTRLMTSLLHGVRPSDPLTLGAVALVTGAVAILASAGPARRAARADPATVLHEG
jgi:predicted permease